MNAPKIRIKLRGFDHKSLDSSAMKIVDTVRRTGAKVSGPVPLPTRIRRFCVLRSPFVNKDSRALRNPHSQQIGGHRKPQQKNH